jgi:Secretion system C-terminal sorting domain/PA domain
MSLFIIKKIKSKMTKLYSVLIAVVVVTSQLYAQTPRVDTIVLSVYNTSQRFMLYPMPFGKSTPASGFTAEMVASLDTVNVMRERPDSAGNNVPMWVTEHVCGKVSADLKGKVALLQLNPACDLSTQVLNAQTAGATTVVMIHTTNNRDSVRLSPTAQYLDSQRVTIPCYTVRQGIGDKVRMMLPSMVGIKILAHDDSSRSDIQNRVTMSNPNAAVPQMTVSKADAPDGTIAEKAEKTVEIVDIGWRLAPNPTTDEITIHYQFAEKTATSLEIFNETGQLVTNYELTPAQTGQLIVNVEAWRTGTYNVRMRHGTLKEVKRFMVIH